VEAPAPEALWLSGNTAGQGLADAGSAKVRPRVVHGSLTVTALKRGVPWPGLGWTL
jgi:hypothetical protein